MRLYKKYLVTERKYDDSAVENWIRDQLSGTDDKMSSKLMYSFAKKNYAGIDKGQFMNVWNELVADGFLVKVGGDNYKWEM